MPSEKNVDMFSCGDFEVRTRADLYLSFLPDILPYYRYIQLRLTQTFGTRDLLNLKCVVEFTRCLINGTRVVVLNSMCDRVNCLKAGRVWSINAHDNII